MKLGVVVRRLGTPSNLLHFVGRRRCSGASPSERQLGLLLPVEQQEDDITASDWYRLAYPKLIKLACALRNIDKIDGRVENVDDGLIIKDHHMLQQMQTFQGLARAFLGSSSAQHAINKEAAAAAAAPGPPAVGTMEPMTLNSLTTVCNFLNISAQQRKSVRLTVCPQVTQHHIWRGALGEVLKDLSAELQAVTIPSPATRMGEQIVSSCVQFLADTAGASNQGTSLPLWMQLAPENRADKPSQMRKWAEVLEMFGDLTEWLGKEERLAGALHKVEAMKEGLYQIKDLLVEREIGHKEARRQDCLVQKKLSKNLGHSSKCLFTLLLYYLHGSVRDLELDSCGLCVRDDRAGGGRLSAGRILTSDDERMVRRSLRQLDRALGVFKFVWQIAGVKGQLELQGNIWCVGAKERSLLYRGNRFFVHDLKL